MHISLFLSEQLIGIMLFHLTVMLKQILNVQIVPISPEITDYDHFLSEEVTF